MLEQGLCDISIEISHLEVESQSNTPETLLEWVLKAVPYGDMACPRLNLALGIPAGSGGVEWKVLSHEAPDIRPINVRRELGLLCEASLAQEKKARLRLKPEP